MIKRNLTANYLGQGWCALMGLAFIPLYIRYLGVEAYGLIGLFATMQVWVTLLDIGMSPTLGREMARFTSGAHTAQSIRALLRSIEVIVYGLACLIALLVWAGSHWLAADWLQAGRLPVDTVAHALSIMALVLGLRFCESIYHSAIIGMQKQVWYNAINSFLQTLRHGGAVAILAFVSPTIGAFFIWQVVVSLLSVSVYAYTLHASLPAAPAPVRFSTGALAEVWRFAAGMIGINVLAVLLTQVDKVLLSRLLSLEHFGYYTLAGVVAAMLYRVVGPVTQAVYPRLVELHAQADDRASARVYHQSAQLVTLATAPLAIVIAAFPAGVLYLWSGNLPLSTYTAPILAPLMLGTFLNVLMWIPYQTQLAHGWTSLTLKMNIVAVGVLVPAILWLVPIYGAVGAAWIWVALNAGYVTIGVHFMYRRILCGEKWRWYGDDLLLPTGGTMAVVALAHYAFLPSMETGRLGWCFFLGTIALLAYGSALVFSSQIRQLVYIRVIAVYRHIIGRAKHEHS